MTAKIEGMDRTVSSLVNPCATSCRRLRQSPEGRGRSPQSAGVLGIASGAQRTARPTLRFTESIQLTKQALLDEYSQILRGREQMFHLALNEAEALAYETGFASLVFPTLAREKAEAVAAWDRRQQMLGQGWLSGFAA